VTARASSVVNKRKRRGMTGENRSLRYPIEKMDNIKLGVFKERLSK
jgi:hypothetical protein